MKIGNKKELKGMAEEKSGNLDYKEIMYDYCMREPNSFMTIDARPTATIPFKEKSININQYKVDRLKAFSSGDLDKYEFLTRKDLNYKPNALDKAKFEFSPLGKTFSMGLDKTADDYQEEGAIKLLKNIRDGLAGNVIRRNNRLDNDNRLDDNDDRPDRPDDRPDRPDETRIVIQHLLDIIEKKL